jgi:hypothetical protein
MLAPKRWLAATVRAFVLAPIAIATVAAAACGSSGGEPAAQATQPAATQPTTIQAVTTAGAQTFMSKRYGFRVTLTEEWTEADALVDWDGKELQGLGSPAWARFTDPATGRTLVAAAARVAKGMELAEWRAAMVRAAPSVCSDSSSAEETTLDGEPALAWTARCSDGYDVNKLAALHGRRGYIILLASPSARDDAEDRQIFESMRSSFRFTR